MPRWSRWRGLYRRLVNRGCPAGPGRIVDRRQGLVRRSARRSHNQPPGSRSLPGSMCGCPGHWLRPRESGRPFRSGERSSRCRAAVQLSLKISALSPFSIRLIPRPALVGRGKAAAHRRCGHAIASFADLRHGTSRHEIAHYRDSHGCSRKRPIASFPMRDWPSRPTIERPLRMWPPCLDGLARGARRSRSGW